MPLNPANVPQEFRDLLPLAEQWGIGDDYEREHAVSAASSEELRRLVSTIQAMTADPRIMSSFSYSNAPAFGATRLRLEARWQSQPKETPQ